MAKKEFRKAYSKNHLRMLGLVWSTPDLFLPEIEKIREIFGIQKDLPAIDPTECPQKYNELRDSGKNKFYSFMENQSDRLAEFHKKLDILRKNLGLGREWNMPMGIFIVSGIFSPPPFSVFVSENEEDKTIIFEINKETTRVDLNLAWKNIEKNREKMFGKSRSVYPNEDTMRNFRDYTRSKVIKFETPHREGALGEKYKTTDVDVAGELFAKARDKSAKKDKERANKLKVYRHRFEKLQNKTH